MSWRGDLCRIVISYLGGFSFYKVLDFAYVGFFTRGSIVYVIFVCIGSGTSLLDSSRLKDIGLIDL